MFFPNCVVALLSPEISLKSDEVRHFIVKRLRENAFLYFKHFKVSCANSETHGGRMIFFVDAPKKAVQALEKCFGFHFLCPAQEIHFSSMEELSKIVVGLCKGKLSKTFAVRGKSFSKEVGSLDLNKALGAAILAQFPALKVNLDSPKSEVHCLTFGERAFIWFEEVEGAHGMPVSAQGTAALLCNYGSKKEDSRLAWFLMRTGCRVSLVDGKEKDFVKASEWNSFQPFTSISIEEAKSRYVEGRIKAFFCVGKTTKKAEEASAAAGTKVFAPLLLLPKTKTPLD